jgi:O-antigen/teichoic acid export membrane protein
LGHGFNETLLTQVGLLALGALTGTAAARLLGPRGRGELAAIILWPSMLVTMASMGMNQAIVFHTGKRRFGFSEVWTASTVLGLLQSLVVLVVGLVVVPLALRTYSPQVRHLAQVFVCCTPALLLAGYPGSLLQGKLDLVSFNAIRLIAPVIYALGLVSLLLMRRPSLSSVLGFLILGVALAVAGGYGILFSKERPRFILKAAVVKSMLSYGWKTQLATVSSYINQRVDQLILSIFVAPQQLGLYVVAVTVSTSLGFLPQASAIVTLASGSNLPPERARPVIASAFRSSLLWLFCSASALFAVAPWLITFVFGARFADSTLACRILLPGTIALGLNQVLYDGARALNEPALPSYAEGLATVLTCVGLALLLPRYGFLGAAIASTVAYSASLTIMLALYRWRLGIGLAELLALTPAHPFGNLSSTRSLSLKVLSPLRGVRQGSRAGESPLDSSALSEGRGYPRYEGGGPERRG